MEGQERPYGGLLVPDVHRQQHSLLALILVHKRLRLDVFLSVQTHSPEFNKGLQKSVVVFCMGKNLGWKGSVVAAEMLLL